MAEITHNLYERQDNPKDQAALWAGGWWRFSRYEMRDGHIRPTANANLEWFDPWEIYRVSKWDKGTQPPYQSLLALMLSIGAHSSESRGWQLDQSLQPGGGLPPVQEAKVLDWCSHFGLLGLLPHFTLAIGLPRRMELIEDRTYHIEAWLVRANGQWDTIGMTDLHHGPEPVKYYRLHTEARPDPLVPWYDPYYQTPAAIVCGRSIRVADLLPEYFPDFKDAGDQFECPRVLSEKFWRIYSESQTGFFQSALALLTLAQPTSGSEEFRTAVARAFMEPVGVSISLDSNGRYQECWACPSLLSSFTRMLLQDLSGGMRVLRCECCHLPFVTESWKARYCSKECGWRHRKRRGRASKTDQSSRE
jgi:hypothetical protein